MPEGTPNPENRSESVFDTPLPVSNAELEAAYRAVLENEAPARELEYLNTHPELFNWGFLNFVRGCDWTNGRYVNVIDRVCQSVSSVLD